MAERLRSKRDLLLFKKKKKERWTSLVGQSVRSGPVSDLTPFSKEFIFFFYTREKNRLKGCFSVNVYTFNLLLLLLYENGQRSFTFPVIVPVSRVQTMAS
jgi:hypothetical protein